MLLLNRADNVPTTKLEAAARTRIVSHKKKNYVATNLRHHVPPAASMDIGPSTMLRAEQAVNDYHRTMLFLPVVDSVAIILDEVIPTTVLDQNVVTL